MKVVLAHQVRLFAHRPAGADELGTPFGALGFDGSVLDTLDDVVEELLGLEVKRHVTVDAEVPVSGGLLPTPRTRNRSDIESTVVRIDVLAVERGVGALERLVAEGGFVASSVVASLDASLTLFDLPALHAQAEEVPRVGLPEDGRRDGLIDASAFGGSTQVFSKHIVRDLLDFIELAPERGVVIVTSRMLREPLVDPRRRQDEVDGMLSGLTVGVDAESVLGLEDVTDLEVDELPTPEAALELEGDGRAGAVVGGFVDHPLGLVEGDEVSFGGLRVEVVGRAGRDPVQGLRRVFGDLAGVAAERAEVAPVVLVSVFVVVGPVDPADNTLRNVPVFERLGETDVGLFAHSAGVSEDVSMPVVADFGGDEFDIVREPEKGLASVFTAAAVAGLDLLAEGVDRDAWIVTAHGRASDAWLVNLWLVSHPWLIPKSVEPRSERPGIRVSGNGDFSAFLGSGGVGA